MSISLIIPLYNEDSLIDDLFDQLDIALRELNLEYEIIVVDDGSTDLTLKKALERRKTDERIKILVLSRNFGHQAAFMAGLAFAKHKLVLTMDGDLQDPPLIIPKMVDKLISENLDVVYGKRHPDSPDLKLGLLKRIFHYTFKRVSPVTYDETVGNFAVFRANVKEALLSYNEKSRYLPGLRFYIGFKQDYIEYHRAKRASGKAKMNNGQLFQLAMDAIFSFSAIPIKICLYAGLLGLVITAIAIAHTLISKVTGIAPFGWSSTVMSIYFLGSVQLIFLGILGEYTYRIYKEVQNRPIYLIKEIYQ